MTTLSWQSYAEVRELLTEPRPTEKTNLLLAGCEGTGSLCNMVRLVLSYPISKRGKLVITVGDIVMRRREIQNLARRIDFPDYLPLPVASGLVAE